MQIPAFSGTSVFLSILIVAHILIIAASNYLVQIPVILGGLHSTWGTFTFPLIFLLTDLTVRLLGARQARAVIFMVMFPALIISYIVSIVYFQGEYQGLSALTTFNLFVFRIALASFIAYVVGQLIDILIFIRLRLLVRWWIAPGVSTIIGALIDTFVFFSIAFYASSDPFMAESWVEIAWVDYAFKLLVSLLFYLPAYGVIISKLNLETKHGTLARRRFS